MTTCIIVEKPSVARNIARIIGANSKQDGYLEGAGYLVTWAFDHLITLAMPEAYGYGAYKAEELPIIPKPFKFIVRQVRKDKTFIDDPSALKQLKVIRSSFERCDQIVVATDAGREGELIFRYIYHYLACHKPFQRLWISPLTDKAIREGLSKLRSGSEYDALYQAGKARSEADWLVGINASRALSIARRGAYSLGRVQTPTLAIVCRRFLEYQHFTSSYLWRLHAFTEAEDIAIQATCTESFEQEDLVTVALRSLSSKTSLKVLSINRQTTETLPPLLYDLTTLQKEANRKFGSSADKTLSPAQFLYEKKLTTYRRTGSRYISEDIFEEAPCLLSSLGKHLDNPLNRHSVEDNKVTDHHAIIPIGESPASLSLDEETLYQVVCARFVQAFAPNSQEERMQVVLSDGGRNYAWKANQLIAAGWKALAPRLKSKEPEENEDLMLGRLPFISDNDSLPLLHAETSQHLGSPLLPLWRIALALRSKRI